MDDAAAVGQRSAHVRERREAARAQKAATSRAILEGEMPLCVTTPAENDLRGLAP
jgi:hypothetical protein